MIDERKKREQRLTTINGFVYFALLAGLFIELFFDGYAIMETLYGIGCIIMFVLLHYSYGCISNLLAILKERGISVAKRTITV